MKSLALAGAVIAALALPIAALAEDKPQVTFTVPVTLTDVRAELFSGEKQGFSNKIRAIDVGCIASDQPNMHLTALPQDERGRNVYSGIAHVPFTASQKTINGRRYDVINYSGPVKVVATTGTSAGAAGELANLRSYSCAMFIDGKNPTELNASTIPDRSGAMLHQFDDASLKASNDGTLN